MDFFLAPVFPPLAVVVGFFVTFVDVLANDDVDFALGVVALGFVCAGAADAGGFVVDGAGVVAAGFLVESTFYLSINRINSKKIFLYTSDFGAAGVALTGFLLAAEAFWVADVVGADFFLSDMLETIEIETKTDLKFID